MKKLLGLIVLASLAVYAGLPPTTLKGGNEAALQTTFQFNLGQIPVTRTGSNVVFGTIPVTQGGTSATSLTQYSLMSGNGTSAVNMIAPSTSGTILFSNGASAFPSYRLLAPTDITTALGYTPAASGAPWVTSGSNIYYTAGNVGIGTTTPGTALSVSGVQTIVGTTADLLTVSRSGFNVWAFRNTSGGLGINNNSLIIKPNSGTGTAADFAVKTTTADGGVPSLLVTAGGLVAIGASDPTTTLDVAGNIRSRGLTSGVVVANSTGNLSSFAPGASGTVLTSTGSGFVFLTPGTYTTLTGATLAGTTLNTGTISGGALVNTRITQTVSSVTVSSTVLLGTSFVSVDSGSGVYTVTIPAAASATGTILTIAKTQATNRTIIATGGGNICGNSTVSLYGVDDSVTIFSNGTAWVGTTTDTCYRTFAGYVNNSNGSSSVITQQPPLAVAATTCTGTGDCPWNLATGVSNSTTFFCNCTAGPGSGATSCTVVDNSVTQLRILTYNGTTPANSSNVSYTCRAHR